MPNHNNRLFVKLYLQARESGLLAALSDRNWKTLCVLATYMNHDGRCNPSQAALARDLRISRGSVSRRIKSLEQFRFHGQPLIRIEKDHRYFGGKYGASSYTILSSSCLAIFGCQPYKKPPGFSPRFSPAA